jgi:chemotaxis protein MotB
LTNRRHIEVEHENHERWLISYADMVTLLFALFVLLFAISQVNQKKYEELSTSLAVAFGTVVNVSDGNDSILPEAGDNVTLNSTPPVDVPAVVIPDIMPKLQEQVTIVMSTPDTVDGVKASLAVQSAVAAEAAAQATLNKAELALASAVSSAGLSGKVVLSREERGLVVTLLVDDIIFPPHSATLQSGGSDAIRALIPAIKDSGSQLVVEGHTNTAPVQPINFPSDWELSSARAGAVARFLNSEGGVARSRMHVAGYADTSPLVPESNPDHLRLNRRVAIVLASSLTEEQRSLLAGARVASEISNANTGQ